MSNHKPRIHLPHPLHKGVPLCTVGVLAPRIATRPENWGIVTCIKCKRWWADKATRSQLDQYERELRAEEESP